MRPIEFDSFAEDVEYVLNKVINEYNFQIIFKDESSFFCKNNNNSIHIFYEGMSIQFNIINSKGEENHIYELLNLKGYSSLVPLESEANLDENFLKSLKDKYEFYIADLKWIKAIGQIIIDYNILVKD
ncbi:hypothetical protein [Pontibacter ramchanderi]|uniref:Uncharacterized protein n=1 Tax=Pontibacter ramchanderi TaxID=1179743 RepID=A0A2N3V350_9BACT|nr:hypothetical protein [Pontibacter ramchanderi]PKV76051.1 hypothetical protein BD749_1001 [Pontibacter ramchanderi]